MASQSLVLTCAYSLLALLLAHTVISAITSPLRSVPGPLLARFSRLWYLRQAWTGKFPRTNIKLHQKYGPIVRIAPNEYSIDDPSAIKPIYGHGTVFVKGSWYHASGAPSGMKQNIFAEIDPKTHAAERRKIASLYTMSTLLKMEEEVNSCISLVEDRFRNFAKSQSTIELQWWMQCYAFDVIGAITVSKRFGFLDAGEDPLGMVEGLDSFLTYAARMGICPELHHMVFSIISKLGKSGLLDVFAFTRDQIQKYKETIGSSESSADSDVFLSKAIRLHREKPDSFLEEDIFQTCSMNVVAGSDTTGISLTAVMWGLLKNPEAMAKLRAEVDEKYESGEISDPVSFADAQKMPYLQACINEGLRTHPAVGLPLSRVVPKGGIVIAGRYFPEGTNIGVNAWAAHNNRSVFGEDADKFRPERWLVDEETYRKMDRYFIPFGHGSRTCIGKNISLMEMSKIIPQLVRKFDIQLSDPDAELRTKNVWFVKQQDVTVKISERKL
ncbi:cytochrome P450 [Neofusicoccum parvum]|nr:cytochrome P450 [Neofusicoccum parvum]